MKFTRFDVAHADSAHANDFTPQAPAVSDDVPDADPDDFPPSSFPDDALADEPPAMQILSAIGDAVGRADVLVLESQRPLDRAALREHFDGQAMNSRLALTRDGRPWVDGFV